MSQETLGPARHSSREWRSLVALFEQPGPEFLVAAHRRLAAGRDTAELRVLMIDRLSRLGLGDLARSLVPTCRTVGADGVDPQELRSALADVPSGRVDWNDLEFAFAANLEVVQSSAPAVARHEGRLRALRADHTLHRMHDGRYLVVRADAAGQTRDIGGLHEPILLDETTLHLRPDSPPVLLIGLALDDVVERAAELTARVQSGRAPLYLLETDEARLLAWLHTGDRRRVLADQRVFLCGSADGLHQYATLLLDQEDLVPAGFYLAVPGAQPGWREVDAVCARVEAERLARWNELAGRLAARGRARSTATWSGRLRPGSTIVGFTSVATTMLRYSMRDIGRALLDLGYRFELACEEAPFRAQSSLTVGRVVDRVDPELIILINHFRHERPQAFGDAPVLTWIQDPTELVLSTATGAALGPHDFVCGYYRDRCVEELGYPPDRFFTTPLPVCHHTFHDAALDRTDRDGFGCDVMYVGHLHETVEEHLARWRNQVAAPLRPLLESLEAEVETRLTAKRHLHFWSPTVGRLADACGVALDTRGREALAGLFAARLFDLRWRRETLGWAAHYARETGRRFRLYGRGWDRSETLAPFAVGEIEHGEPLRRAYRGANLVLQTVPGGFMHQRTYEGLASGTAVIARDCPTCVASRYFPEVDEVTFHDEPSFVALAQRLLDDPDARETIARRDRAVVLEQFTYLAVLRRVIENVRSALDGPNALNP